MSPRVQSLGNQTVTGRAGPERHVMIGHIAQAQHRQERHRAEPEHTEDMNGADTERGSERVTHGGKDTLKKLEQTLHGDISEQPRTRYHDGALKGSVTNQDGRRSEGGTMTTVTRRSAYITGFLAAAHDLLEGDAKGQERVQAELDALEGPNEPKKEEERREALAKWATHRWAPICLRLAGFDELADMIEQTGDAQKAAELLDSIDLHVPAEPKGTPQNPYQVAGQACADAFATGAQISPCIGPAYTVLMAAKATCHARAAGVDCERISMADETIDAARAAMDGRGPEAQTTAEHRYRR